MVKYFRGGRFNFDFFALAVGFILLAFIFIIIANMYLSTSPLDFAAQLMNPLVQSAVIVSLATSLTASFLGLALGIPLAYFLAHRRFRGVELLDTLIDLPMVLPPTVAGLSIIMLLGPYQPLGSLLRGFGIEVLYTFKAMVLAQFFVSTPFLVRSARAAFESLDGSLEKAARTLGASSLYIFRRITLPLSYRGILAGWVMMWARALGEFGAVIMVSSNMPGVSYVLPTAIYFFFLGGTVKMAIACSIILLTLAFIILTLTRRLAPSYVR